MHSQSRSAKDWASTTKCGVVGAKGSLEEQAVLATVRSYKWQ